MPRRVVVAALFVCLLPVPSATAAHVAVVGAVGPDPDGAFSLTYDVHRDAAGVAALSLDVERTDADGTVLSTRDLGSADLPAGTTARTVTFLPAEGAGSYRVALVVDGVASEPIAFDVDDAGASASVAFDVPDAPTYVNLTNDTVNADGKVKSPGEALVTRGVVSDANGLVDVDALAWNVEQDDAFVAGDVLPLPGAGTSWSFEHRFDRTPFAAGNYTMALRAIRDGAIVASASRTFAIREVAPTFVSGALANVTPDADATQTVSVVLADKNGAPSGELELRVYRASTRVESAGFAATFGAPTRLADEGGAGRTAYPLALSVPARAASGAYRVSLYADGALLGAMPFDVLPLPTLAGVDATTAEGRLVLDARGVGDGIVRATLGDGEGSSTTVAAAFANGSATLVLDAPRRGVPLVWNVTLAARADGPGLAWAEGSWSAAADGASVALEPLFARARLPAAWRVNASWGLADATATFAFTRWDGQPEHSLTGALQGDRARIDAPASITAGRYTARMTLAWPNGSVAETSWSFDAGPWVEIELGAPTVAGRSATVPLRNVGGLAITRLVVEAEPAANLTLELAGTTLAPTSLAGGMARFSATLAPGDEATLHVQLPGGPQRSGRHDVALRVLARVEIG